MNSFILGNVRKLLISLFALISIFPVASYARINPDLATEILVYINQYRVQHNLSKLVMNETLSKEAAKHSIEMAKHIVPFGHDGFSSRISNLHKKIPNSLAGAENVAYNYKTAEIVADGWIKSYGHRKNIVGNYNLTGIGIAEDEHGKLYFTQMFLRKEDGLVSAKNNRTRRSHGFFAFG